MKKRFWSFGDDFEIVDDAGRRRYFVRSFSWANTYGVDIAAGGDDALILASAVVIDLACHNEQND